VDRYIQGLLYNDSASHHRCEDCGFDGSTWEKLLEYHRKTQHRVVCQGCDDGEGMTWIPGSHEYLDHLKEQNVCTTCEEHFQSPSNLDNISRESVLSRAAFNISAYQRQKPRSPYPLSPVHQPVKNRYHLHCVKARPCTSNSNLLPNSHLLVILRDNQ
jgi:hypothetical protein